MEGTSLAKRLTISAILIAIVYTIIFKAPIFLFLVCASAFIVISLYELYLLFEKNNLPVDKTIGMIFGALFPFFFYFSGEALIFIFSLLIVLVLHFGKRERHPAILKAAVTLFGLFYIGWLFSFFAKLRFLTDGTKWIAYVIWVTKMGDAGAYFIGSNFGKTKLFAQVSPKKSLEGAIGGFLFSCAVSLFFKAYLIHIPVIHFLILGVLLGVLTQVGDFTESIIKRDLGIKDSGNIPGLGGIVDIIDSLLFTAPFLYYYLIAIVGVS